MPILPAAVVAAALLTCTVVTAQAAQLIRTPNAGTGVVVRDIIHPLAPQWITQNFEPYTLRDHSTVACSDGVNSLENAWLRLFDLDDDHGLVDTFTVWSVDWATERVVGASDITVNVYCLDESLPFLYMFMELKDSAATPVADEVLTFHNTPVGGSCDSATEDMAVELFAEDCNIAGCTICKVGSNREGATAPTYIATASCGYPEPTDLNLLGFPMDLVMTVNGNDETPYDVDDGGHIPATTGVGAILLLLILLGSGAYFLRRRAAA
jgi:hypothetical protein